MQHNTWPYLLNGLIRIGGIWHTELTGAIDDPIDFLRHRLIDEHRIRWYEHSTLTYGGQWEGDGKKSVGVGGGGPV
jgi:hypothetical protein